MVKLQEMKKINIDYLQFKEWLDSTLKPAGIYVEGNSNVVGENYSNCGIEVVGENNLVYRNISNWLKVGGDFNEVIGNTIFENIQRFSRQEREQLLKFLDEPKTNQFSIKNMLKKLFSGVSIVGGITLVGIPGAPSFYIEIEKKLIK